MGIVTSLNGSVINITFGGLEVDSERDLQNLLTKVAPVIAKEMFAAKAAGKKDWAVSGTVSTSSGGTTGSVTGTVSGKEYSKDYNVSVSASTSVAPGVTATVTGTTGTQGQSGTIGITGSF